jgi:ADP-ribose pyrophosphatase YjhB (NUDIX family)
MATNEIIKNLSIDCIIYSFHENKIHILLVRHAEGKSIGEWGLPGGYVRENEDLDEAAVRTLKLHTGLEDIYLEQLKAFGCVDRFPEERVITISYFALVKYEDIHLIPGESVFEVKWYALGEQPPLIFDHDQILNFSLNRLRQIVRHEPIGFRLLPQEFTLLQLQSLYEEILDTKFDKPNFRRKLLKMKLLIETKNKQQNVSHRAATLYRYDMDVYFKLKEKGFSFDL